MKNNFKNKHSNNDKIIEISNAEICSDMNHSFIIKYFDIQEVFNKWTFIF